MSVAEQAAYDLVVGRMVKAFVEADLDGSVADFAEDGVLVVPLGLTAEGQLAGPLELRGRAAIREFNLPYFAYFADFQVETHAFLARDDVAAWEWTLSYASKRSGRRTAFRGASVVRLRAGQISHWRDYWDSQELLRR